MEILWDGLVPYKYMYIVAWVAVFNDYYHVALLNSQIDIYCSSTPLPHCQLQRSGSE